MFGSRNYTETVIALSAIVTAVIALVVGVWENVQERHHNRLSVVPSLVYVVEVAPREENGPLTATVRVVNEGMGPALLQQSHLELAGPEGERRRYPNWSVAAPVLTDLGVTLRSRTELTPGTVLGVGNSLNLVRLEFAAGSGSEGEAGSDGYARTTELLKHLEINIRYQSIYEQEFEAALSR